jgi:hypothetical protein
MAHRSNHRGCPVPATTVVTPLDTLRTTALLTSAMYKLPDESAARPLTLSEALPVFTATVVITPFVTLRMTVAPKLPSAI